MTEKRIAAMMWTGVQAGSLAKKGGVSVRLATQLNVRVLEMGQ